MKQLSLFFIISLSIFQCLSQNQSEEIFVLDSILGESSTTISRSIFVYDENLDLSESISEFRQKDSLIWRKGERNIYMLNKQGDLETVYFYGGDYVSNVWFNDGGSQYIYTYNSEGFISRSLKYSGGIGEDWTLIARDTMTYQNNRMVDSTILFLRNNVWSYDSKHSFKYNSNGIISSIEYAYYSKGNWVTISVKEFTHNSKSLKSSMTQKNEGVNVLKTEYYYDNYGNDTLDIQYTWNSATSKWMPRERYSKTYNLSIVREKIKYPFNFSTDGLIHQLAKKSKHTFNSTNQIWEEQFVETYYYSNRIVGLNNDLYTDYYVFPNPTQNTIYFSEEINKLTIQDLTGKVRIQSYNPSKTVDVSELDNGSYILLLETDKGLVSEKLLISK